VARRDGGGEPQATSLGLGDFRTVPYPENASEIIGMPWLTKHLTPWFLLSAAVAVGVALLHRSSRNPCDHDALPKALSFELFHRRLHRSALGSSCYFLPLVSSATLKALEPDLPRQFGGKNLCSPSYLPYQKYHLHFSGLSVGPIVSFHCAATIMSDTYLVLLFNSTLLQRL
jgi:hypothetical protein